MVDSKFRPCRETISRFSVLPINVKLVQQAVQHMQLQVHWCAGGRPRDGFHRNTVNHAGGLADLDAQFKTAALVDSAHVKAVKLREKGWLPGELDAEQMLEEFAFRG
jgi:hypothetical protein